MRLYLSVLLSVDLKQKKKNICDEKIKFNFHQIMSEECISTYSFISLIEQLLTLCVTWKRCVYINKSGQETFSTKERR
ncbi:hypothetical protein T02_16307 [Trichinella nativa]|uniref:Uncharacterized protein n=1 Tax=Trichinella nativa TaxID=6335 RepID=A0A0V1KX84_9BILA|nr:hypothetical protein T02_16307 [Trichinella nativa]